MTTKLTKIKSMVLFELTERPETRNSDRLLIYWIYRDYFGVWDNEVFFNIIMRDDLPSFETIRRCRAKVQSERPDLRAKDEVIKFRADNEQAYFTFFGEV